MCSRRGRYRWKARRLSAEGGGVLEISLGLFHRSEECGKTHMWNSRLQSPNVETLLYSHVNLRDTSITDYQEVTYVVQLYPTIFTPWYSNFPERCRAVHKRITSLKQWYYKRTTMESYSFRKVFEFFYGRLNFNISPHYSKINSDISRSNFVGHMQNIIFWRGEQKSRLQLLVREKELEPCWCKALQAISIFEPPSRHPHIVKTLKSIKKSKPIKETK